MKNRKLFSCVSSILVFLCCLCASTAVDAANDPLIVVTELNSVGGDGKHVEFFTNYDPGTTTAVYNEAGGVSLTSGQVNVADMAGKKTVSISLPTLNSDAITVRAECQLMNQTTWGEIQSVTYTTALPLNDIWPLSEYMGKIRFTVFVVGTVSAGDDISVVGDFLRWN